MKHIEVFNQYYHLQGFTTDGEFMYWSFTDVLVKTTMQGIMKIQVPVATRWEHLGGIDYHNGRIYCACMSRNPAGSSVHIYDADTLALVDTILLKNVINDMNRGIDDNNGAGCITIGIDPETSEEVILVGCATKPSSHFDGQIVMQYDMKGNFQKKHIVPTGCTDLGIQNIDRDPETGCYWMTSYGKREEHHIKETLFCISPDLKTVQSSYVFFSAVGLHCLGNDRFYFSCARGTKGRNEGYAYEADLDFVRKTDEHSDGYGSWMDYLKSQFDSEMGL